MTVWHVWTDGSCKHPEPHTSWTHGFGGWCAIVEHDHDGWNLRGRERDTTNVRMELRAMIEGLRSTPEGAVAVLHADCTVVYSVLDALERGTLAQFRGRDATLWRELGAEIEARTVAVDLLGKGVRDERHLLAHGYAGAEARACLLEMPENATPYEVVSRKGLRRRRRKIAERSLAATQQGVRAGAVRLRHSPACSAGFCVYGCPVWQHRHPKIRLSPPLGY